MSFHSLFSCLLVSAFFLPAQQQQQRCGTSQHPTSRFDLEPESQRLVGGVVSVPHAWPWTGELLFDNRHQCGCSLISTEYVVTAAHCFSRTRDPSHYRVLLGGPRDLLGLTSVLIHPLYQIRASAYDIALLKISPRAELNSTINTVCLPTAAGERQRGWGRLKENGERSNILREIHVPIVSPVICNDFHHYGGRVFQPTMLCAGYADGKVDACQGDSGGPLMCLSGDTWQLQGIVSWGIGCAAPNFPGVYTESVLSNRLDSISNGHHRVMIVDESGGINAWTFGRRPFRFTGDRPQGVKIRDSREKSRHLMRSD
ncbi:Serine proteinase [Aphelenchoides fujianensis]|nr:Serine proteinase [Aphelenchoides fujianensis]